MEEKRWLTPSDLHKEYAIAISTQNKMRMRGEIPYSKVGKKFVRYDRNEIDKWLESKAVSK
jgi:predicted DNA-binding transcriptional regulator AlpA